MAAMAELAGLTGLAGLGAQPGGATPQSVAEISGENPSPNTEKSPFLIPNTVSEADLKILVDIISEYRNSWAQDRLERIRQWMQTNA